MKWNIISYCLLFLVGMLTSTCYQHWLKDDEHLPGEKPRTGSASDTLAFISLDYLIGIAETAGIDSAYAISTLVPEDIWFLDSSTAHLLTRLSLETKPCDPGHIWGALEMADRHYREEYGPLLLDYVAELLECGSDIYSFMKPYRVLLNHQPDNLEEKLQEIVINLNNSRDSLNSILIDLAPPQNFIIRFFYRPPYSLLRTIHALNEHRLTLMLALNELDPIGHPDSMVYDYATQLSIDGRGYFMSPEDCVNYYQERLNNPPFSVFWPDSSFVAEYPIREQHDSMEAMLRSNWASIDSILTDWIDENAYRIHHPIIVYQNRALFRIPIDYLSGCYGSEIVHIELIDRQRVRLTIFINGIIICVS